MAQQFYRPGRNGSSSGGRLYDDEAQNPSAGGASERTRNVVNNANDSLGNIDDALSSNAAFNSRGDRLAPADLSTREAQAGFNAQKHTNAHDNQDYANDERAIQQGNNNPSLGTADTRPDLRSMEGLKKSGATDLAHLNKGAQRGQAKHGSLMPSTDLRAASNLLGPEGAAALKGFAKLKDALWGNKQKQKRTMIGGGAVGTLVGGGFLVVIAILPNQLSLQIDHVQNEAMAQAQDAISEETENAFDTYLRNHVFPGLGPHCPSTRADKSCAAAISGKGPVVTMFKQWRLANLEGKLADKYGIEFQKAGIGKFAKLQVRISANSEWIQLDPTRHVFQQLDKLNPEASNAIRSAIKTETRYPSVFWRFGQRGIADKYGDKRCLIACDLRAKWNDAVKLKQEAFFIFFAQRVIQPHLAELTVAVQCIMDTNCKPQNVKANDGNALENGAPESDYEKRLDAARASIAEKFTTESLKDALSSVNDVLKEGFAKYFANQIAAAIAGKFTDDAATKELSGEIASKAVPVVGWANLAAEVVDNLKNFGPKMQKIVFVTNLSGMISTWMMYRSAVDEFKSGHTNLPEYNSVADSLQPSENGPGAASSPLYGQMFDSTQSTATALLQTFLPSKVYAASSKKPTALEAQKYLNFCDGHDPDNPIAGKDDKKPVRAGKLICPEESLIGAATLANEVSNAIPGPVADLASYWTGTVGKIFGVIGDILSNLPGVKQLGDLLNSAIAPLLNLIVTNLIPNPFHTVRSGARNFDLLAGGAFGTGSETAHNVLGGQKLTNTQAAAIVNKQIEEQKQQFDSQSFWARLFDKNSEYSLVGQVALALPGNVQSSAVASFADLISNPLGKLFRGFGALFTTNHAFAAQPAQDNPFGIPYYGYPPGSIPSDPEAYWNAHCTDTQQTDAWNAAAAANVDPLTQMPENTTTNPCLLIQEMGNSATQLF